MCDNLNPDLATWPSLCGTAHKGQILRDGFDSRLEPIVFDILYIRVAADSKSASSLHITVEFSVRSNLKLFQCDSLFTSSSPSVPEINFFFELGSEFFGFRSRFEFLFLD